MKLFWTLQLGIGAASLAFLTAHGCGGNVVVDGSTGTTTDTTTSTQSGTDTTTETESFTEVGTETETFSEGGTETETPGADCACACMTFMSSGGCADICSTFYNGLTNNNFCEGVAPLAQCAACLANNCPGLSQAAGTCTGM